ncbi:MAG: HDOD domain-containing protein [Lachnospiraceae bacterium]|nr:HDOD domain-containing protein [Lachnospiraceae bacterium]
MLATLMPLFDEDMAVKAYSVFAQRENYFMDPFHGASGRLDNATRIEGFEIVESMGLETLSDDKEVFIPVGNASIYADIASQSSEPHEKIVLLIDRNVKPENDYVSRVKELKDQGYKFAVRKIRPHEFGDYRDILNLMDYVLLDHRKVDMKKAQSNFRKIYPNLKICAVNVNTKEEFDALKEVGGFSFYEGDFFRMPVNTGDTEIAPLKATYVELLKVVNNPDFDLTDAADIIGTDTALVVSLLEMVNHWSRNSDITSVRHAAAMLGQKELKKWINTAVTKELCADKPSEITRLSLIRAKFAENLAPAFEMAPQSSELFLMGLFSVLDIILDRPMEEALESVSVSKQISDALLSDSGQFSEVLDFFKAYEVASWQEVSRIMVLKDFSMDWIYRAYLESLQWYRDLITLPVGKKR